MINYIEHIEPGIDEMIHILSSSDDNCRVAGRMFHWEDFHSDKPHPAACAVGEVFIGLGWLEDLRRQYKEIEDELDDRYDVEEAWSGVLGDTILDAAVHLNVPEYVLHGLINVHDCFPTAAKRREKSIAYLQAANEFNNEWAKNPHLDNTGEIDYHRHQIHFSQFTREWLDDYGE